MWKLIEKYKWDDYWKNFKPMHKSWKTLFQRLVDPNPQHRCEVKEILEWTKDKATEMELATELESRIKLANQKEQQQQSLQ